MSKRREFRWAPKRIEQIFAGAPPPRAGSAAAFLASNPPPTAPSDSSYNDSTPEQRLTRSRQRAFDQGAVEAQESAAHGTAPSRRTSSRRSSDAPSMPPPLPRTAPSRGGMDIEGLCPESWVDLSAAGP